MKKAFYTILLLAFCYYCMKPYLGKWRRISDYQRNVIKSVNLLYNVDLLDFEIITRDISYTSNPDIDYIEIIRIKLHSPISIPNLSYCNDVYSYDVTTVNKSPWPYRFHMTEKTYSEWHFQYNYRASRWNKNLKINLYYSNKSDTAVVELTHGKL